MAEPGGSAKKRSGRGGQMELHLREPEAAKAVLVLPHLVRFRRTIMKKLLMLAAAASNVMPDVNDGRCSDPRRPEAHDGDALD